MKVSARFLFTISVVLCFALTACSSEPSDAAIQTAIVATQQAAPTATAAPTDTPLPTQTATEMPEPAASATATSEPTYTPRPTFTRSATSTSTPSPTPSATPTPAATATPAASPTPAPTDTPAASPTPSMQAATVTRIIDGDTIEVAIDGQAYTVRYIGMDSPEADAPSEDLRQYAALATQTNSQLVLNQTVYLEKDVSETDQYGRLLRYVYLANGTMVNAELVRLGYAQASSYPPDITRQAALNNAQAEAVAGARGLWAPTPEPTAPPVAATGAQIAIVAVDKREEYVDIVNRGDQAQDLGGWVLLSERGDQACGLSGVLEAGAALRIWAMAEDAGLGGYNCGFGSNIWNNSEPDPAALYDAAGGLVDRW